MDSEFSFAEYAVKPKHNREATCRRLFFVLFNIVLDLTAAYLCFRFNLALIAAVTAAAVPLWFWSMRFAGTEFEYAVEAGELTLDVLHGNFRHTVFSVDLSSVSAVVPDTDEYADKLLRYAPVNEYIAYSAPDSPDRYYALFTDHEKNRCVFRFDATGKTLRAFRAATGNATVVTKVRY